MATYPKSTSEERARRMREAWTGLKGGMGSVFVYLYGFFTTYPPLAQGSYYVLCAVWPLLSVTTYQEATGHQGDQWYAEKISAMLLAVGATLCLSAYRRQGTPEILFLSLASAFGMVAVDIHMLYRGFSLFYLLDAILELGLVSFWIHGWKTFRMDAAPVAQVAPPPGAAVPQA
jgi:hypothetical protein